MNRLQSQFHPDRFDPVQTFQKIQHIFSKTVRPCGHRQNLYIRIPDGTGKNVFQIIHRSIGVGKCLKIGNVGADRAFLRQILFPSGELRLYRKSGGAGKITGAFCAAEDTSAGTAAPVPIRTGHASVQCDFVDLFAKCIFQFIVKRIIPPFAPAFFIIHKKDILPAVSYGGNRRFCERCSRHL